MIGSKKKFKLISALPLIVLLLYLWSAVASWPVGASNYEESNGYKEKKGIRKQEIPWQMFRNNHLRNGYSPVRGFDRVRLAWKFHGNNEFLSSPAIGPDGTIYIGCDDNFIYAINSNGTLKWKVRTGYHVISSPAIDDQGNICVGSEDSNLYVISPDGKVLRKIKTGGFVNSSPLVYGNRVYFCSEDGSLYFIDKREQTIREGFSGSPNYSSPLADDVGSIYFCGRRGTINKIENGARVNWSLRTQIYSTPASIGKRSLVIGCDDGLFFSLSFKYMEKKKNWQYKTKGKIRASPAVSPINKNIYIGSFDKNFYCLDQNGKLKWKFKTGGEIESSAALTGDGKSIFGSNDGKIYCLDSKGKSVWSFKTGGDVASSPAIGPGFIVVGSEDNYLYCLRDIGNQKSEVNIRVSDVGWQEVAADLPFSVSLAHQWMLNLNMLTELSN